MSGFGSLYYTDCVPGQGLQGGAGFQFQAATPGPATEAMHVVQRSALYEPPAAWMRDRRPVEAYPRSLAHTVEEGFLATAAGRYLGQEANGTRQGNQFTHAVVTREPLDYGGVRPAQLWGAPLWAQAPASGTTLPELPPDPVPGPLSVETVRDRVRQASGAEPMLTALVSALQHLFDPDRRRTVVLVGEDPEWAACWLAAATLLLPSSRALRISFKIFVADPQYARHEVVALHPEWAGRWADTRADSGLAVFHLDRLRCSDVGTTDAADFWVPRFLGDDPYDVVDAVEMAGQFAALRSGGPGASDDDGPGSTAADRLVAAVNAAREPLRSPEEVADVAEWLRTAPGTAVEVARDDALKAVLVTEPPAEVLRTLAAAVAGGVWEPAAVHRVLDGLLTAELTEAVEASDGVAALRAVRGRAPLRPPDRTARDRTGARETVEKVLRSAAADRFPALLTVARRHDVVPRPTEIRAAADAFARWWVRQPHDALAPDRWDAPDLALEWVRGVLREDLRGPRAAAAERAIEDGWWKPLAAAAHDPGDRLDRIVWSAEYVHRENEDAARLRRAVLDACRERYGAPRAGAYAWRIVNRFVEMRLSECLTFVRELEERGLPLSDEVAGEMARAADRQGRLSADGLRLAHVLHRHGHRLPPQLDEQRERDLRIDAIVDDLRAQRPARSPDDLAKALNGVSAPMLALRLRALVDALVDAPTVRAATVLAGAGTARLNEINRELEARWPRPGRPVTTDQGRAAALVFVVTAHARGTQQKDDFAVLRNRLVRCVTALGRDERATVFRALPADLRDEWIRWLRDAEPNLLKRGLSRLSGGLRAEPGTKEG